MSGRDDITPGMGELVNRLEATLNPGEPPLDWPAPVGPTRRLTLRAQRASRQRLTVLQEFLTLAYEAIHANWADLKERGELVTALRALARRIEEGP